MSKKSNRSTLTVLLIIVVAVGLLGLGGFSRLATLNSNQNSAGVSNNLNQGSNIPCIDPSLPVPDQYHIHPHLTIIINGQNVTIPEDIGISLTCERVLHTHDDTGTIHVEPNYYQRFTLGDFFSVWGGPFSESQILNYVADQNHAIVMTVNGVPSSEYQNLVLEDKQQIVIEYKEIVNGK